MKKILAQHRSQICVWKKPSSLGLEIRQKWFRTSSVKICSRLDVFTLLDKLISPWSQTNVISFTCIKSHQNFTMVAVSYRRRLLANWSGRTFAESWQVWSLYQLIFVNFYPVKPNLYASGRHPDMNQTWLFVCSRKFKISSWAFLDGHPVKILKLSYQDMNQNCKNVQTSHFSPSRFDTDMHPEMQPAFEFPATYKKSRLVHIRVTSWRV